MEEGDIIYVIKEIRPLKYTMKDALADIGAEYYRAINLHPTPMRSAHEGFAILKEEVDELWEEIRLKEASKKDMKREAEQVGAMAVRFLIDVIGGQK